MGENLEPQAGCVWVLGLQTLFKDPRGCGPGTETPEILPSGLQKISGSKEEAKGRRGVCIQNCRMGEGDRPEQGRAKDRVACGVWREPASFPEFSS